MSTLTKCSIAHKALSVGTPDSISKSAIAFSKLSKDLKSIGEKPMYRSLNKQKLTC